jgi:Holliday junction resolvase RusA-like endonuclease
MSNPFSIIDELASIGVNKHEILVYGKKQIILGNPVAKSNAYNIVTIKPKDSLKKSFSSLAKTKQLKEYEKSFWAQCNVYRNAHINVQFKIEIDVFFARANSDLDNACKGTMDSLAECNAIVNDSLCYELVMRKHVDSGNPRIEFVITPLKP